jgi:hypothetical protein
MTSIVSTSAGYVQHVAATGDGLVETTAAVAYPRRDYLPVRIDIGVSLAKLPHAVMPDYGEGAVVIHDAALHSALVETNGADVLVSDAEASPAGVHEM